MKQEIFTNGRTAKLCFYADNPNYGYNNRLFCFYTNSPDYVDYILWKFLAAGNIIRIAYVNFSDKSRIIVQKKQLDSLANHPFFRQKFTYLPLPLPFA